MTLITGALTALWLGILTSIHPCPLAANIAAISYIGKHIGNMRRLILGGFFYTAGRMLAYVALSFIVMLMLLSISSVSTFLQTYINKIIGPFLILTGIILIGLFSIPLQGIGLNPAMQGRIEKSGYLGAFFLGFLFALSFCPMSAAVFFGTLIPLTIHSHLRVSSGILLPSLFGFGTALPVLGFAFLMASSKITVGKAFKRLQRVEKFARYGTGIIFIIIGIFLTMHHIFGLH